MSQLRLCSSFSRSYNQLKRNFSSSRQLEASKSSTSSTSTSTSTSSESPSTTEPAALSHLNAKGEAHMISISHKLPTKRVATATATLLFSHPTTHAALSTSVNKKGDAIAVARIAAIQAAKQTANLIPLAHPSLGITGISVDITPFTAMEKSIAYREHADLQHSKLEASHGGVDVRATVSCEGKTGVEMEALVSATMGALTLYDMLKGVDKAMVVMNARVIEKRGGKSGGWRWNNEKGEIERVDKERDQMQQQQRSTDPLRDSTYTTEIDEWNEGLAGEFRTSSEAENKRKV